jgi:hypothetical protein
MNKRYHKIKIHYAFLAIHINFFPGAKQFPKNNRVGYPALFIAHFSPGLLPHRVHFQVAVHF